MRRRLVLAALALLAVGVVFVPLGSARAQDLPGDVTIEATGPGGAVYSYDAGDLICTPPSGSVFTIGQTTVSCVDADNNPAGSFVVTVQDTTPPGITVPSDISVNGTGPTVVTYTEPTASDIVGFCKERLADFKRPKKVHITQAIPRTATGKIQRGAVAKAFSEA